MAKYVPISKTAFEHKTWKRVVDFRFAAKERVIPILGSEIPAAASEMPLGFIKVGKSVELVALVATRGENLYVAPNGTWLVQYTPAWLRAYPFRLIRTDGSEKAVLCIDQDSDRLAEGTGSESFFDDGGKPTKAIENVLAFLQAIERNRTVTSLAVAALHEANLIVPWAISTKTSKGNTPINGLHKIDAARLHGLAPEAFLKLRSTGSLPIAYGQLFSMHQISTLGRLDELQKRLREKSAQGKPSPEQIQEMFKLNDDMIQF